MRHAQIFAVGRLKEPLLRHACDDYYRRCHRTVVVEERELRDLAALKAALPDRATLVVLDERGEQLTSRAFAERLRGWIEGASPLLFVIGGADGLDEEMRSRARLLLSLGRMTFAHRLVRLILAEQLYRAVSILEGSPYHRE